MAIQCDHCIRFKRFLLVFAFARFVVNSFELWYLDTLRRPFVNPEQKDHIMMFLSLADKFLCFYAYPFDFMMGIILFLTIAKGKANETMSIQPSLLYIFCDRSLLFTKLCSMRMYVEFESELFILNALKLITYVFACVRMTMLGGKNSFYKKENLSWFIAHILLQVVSYQAAYLYTSLIRLHNKHNSKDIRGETISIKIK